jgi:hypothetical protein
MIIRESIYAALWALGAGAARFASANRRLRHWSDLAPIEQPALFMSEKGGHAATKVLGGVDSLVPLRGLLHLRALKRPVLGSGYVLKSASRCD